jgi:hypothetical protein
VSGEEEFEAAVSIAASLACTIQSQDSLLDLMFVGAEAYCFTSGRGVRHIEQMLEILAAVQMCPEKEFGALENLVLTHAADLSGCVCVFLSWDPERQQLVKRLLALDVPLRVLVVTAGADSLPPGVMESQRGHFHVLPLGRVAEKLAAL